MTEHREGDRVAELRDRVIEALRTAPATGHSYMRGHERFDHHPLPDEPGHNYLGACALCRGDLDALGDAVMQVVGPVVEGWRRRAEGADRVRAWLDRDPNPHPGHDHLCPDDVRRELDGEVPSDA